MLPDLNEQYIQGLDRPCIVVACLCVQMEDQGMLSLAECWILSTRKLYQLSGNEGSLRSNQQAMRCP